MLVAKRLPLIDLLKTASIKRDTHRHTNTQIDVLERHKQTFCVLIFGGLSQGLEFSVRSIWVEMFSKH